jgi:hypothetical protein
MGQRPILQRTAEHQLPGLYVANLLWTSALRQAAM